MKSKRRTPKPLAAGASPRVDPLGRDPEQPRGLLGRQGAAGPAQERLSVLRIPGQKGRERTKVCNGQHDNPGERLVCALEHLFPASRALTMLDAEERIRGMRADCWISYPRGQTALAKLEELIAFPQRARMPNLPIVGEHGMGKTMIVEKFARDHPAYYDEASGVKRMLVIVVQMVSGPQELRFYKRVLAAIGSIALRLLEQTRPGIESG